ncbi:MAG: Hsp20/alpha crystallin family protein [bacterium]
MFTRFSNAFDTLAGIQNAVEAARLSDYFGYSTTQRGAYPFINLFQENDNIILTAEVPGLKKEEIKLEIKEHLLRISGKREIVYPEKASVHRLERRNYNFDRTIKLPVKVDANKVNAEYKNGILKVVLPRAESDKPKSIEIN